MLQASLSPVHVAVVIIVITSSNVIECFLCVRHCLSSLHGSIHLILTIVRGVMSNGVEITVPSCLTISISHFTCSHTKWNPKFGEMQSQLCFYQFSRNESQGFPSHWGETHKDLHEQLFFFPQRKLAIDSVDRNSNWKAFKEGGK